MNRFLLAAALALNISIPLHATVISFAGDLRNNATFTSCGTGCSLSPLDPDADWAQYSAVVLTINVPTFSHLTANTYGWGGGVQGNGNIVGPGGFAPYLSLFDGTGSFLASTYFGLTCPPGALASAGFCYDVLLEAGNVGPGLYQLVVTAYQNLSLAENYLGISTLNLSDGFTYTGQLDAGRNLAYALDVSLGPPIPEPGPFVLIASALIPFGLIHIRRNKQ